MIALDSNVVIYALDPRETVRKHIAQRLLAETADLVLPWQVLCEVACNLRKLEGRGLGRAEGRRHLRDLRARLPVLLPQAVFVERTLDLQDRYGLSFWDANLVAACLEGAVKTLYSEDITGYPQIEGLTLVNPFAQEVAR